MILGTLADKIGNLSKPRASGDDPLPHEIIAETAE